MDNVEHKEILNEHYVEVAKSRENLKPKMGGSIDEFRKKSVA